MSKALNRNSLNQRYCYSCKEYKDDKEFNKLSSSQDGLDYYCKKCKSNKNSKYYQEKHKVILKQKRQKEKQQLLQLIKFQKDIIKDHILNVKTEGCLFCNEKTPCCLDFHHVNRKDKKFLISQSISNGHSIKDILEEMLKCIVVCSNCHRKIHAGIIKCQELSQSNQPDCAVNV